MKNGEALDRELAEIREKLAGRGRLEAMLAELDGEQQALRERKRALRAELDKEQADVDALEGMSLAAIWQTVLGRREEALDQERREAAAARANYQSAVRALEDVEGRWRQTRERLRALDGLEDRCRALLEEKRRRMAQSDPALGGRIRELEEKLAACRSTADPSVTLRPMGTRLPRKRVTQFKGIYLTGWEGDFLLDGDPETLCLLYQTGLGDRNSQGFGMFRMLL